MKNTEKERFSGSKGSEKRSFVYELRKQKAGAGFPAPADTGVLWIAVSQVNMALGIKVDSPGKKMNKSVTIAITIR